MKEQKKRRRLCRLRSRKASGRCSAEEEESISAGVDDILAALDDEIVLSEGESDFAEDARSEFRNYESDHDGYDNIGDDGEFDHDHFEDDFHIDDHGGMGSPGSTEERWDSSDSGSGDSCSQFSIGSLPAMSRFSFARSRDGGGDTRGGGRPS